MLCSSRLVDKTEMDKREWGKSTNKLRIKVTDQLYSLNILHRDIKLGNGLKNESGNIKLTGFG